MADEQDRLAALLRYGVTGVPDRVGEPEDDLAAVVRLAAEVTGAPTATLNLIDDRYQYQRAAVGFTAVDCARSDSMCAVRLLEGRTVLVADASRHPDYAANPWVDGRLADVRFYLSVPLITPDGHVIGTLCVFDDRPRELTQRQVTLVEGAADAVMSMLERRRMLLVDGARPAGPDRAETELVEFAAAASHDLRAPLTVVDGYLELLTDVYGDQLTDQGRTWVGTARTALVRVFELMEALHGFARVGGGSCACEEVELGPVFDLAAAELRAAAESIGARIRAPEVLPTVHGDEALLRQMLRTLLAGGLSSPHPDRPCLVTFDAVAIDGGWRLTVADNGRGIPHDRRDQVFAMFASPDAAAVGGHGIGLATCRRVVERHGGRIWVEDAPGGGTAVQVTLPEQGFDRSGG